MSVRAPHDAAGSRPDIGISRSIASTPDENMQPPPSLWQTRPDRSFPSQINRRPTLSNSSPSMSTSIWAPKHASPSPPDTKTSSHFSPGSSSSQNPHDLHKCVVCQDEFPLREGSFTCSKHFMDLHCLHQAFKFATQDNSMSMFPAKCCVPIDLSLCGHLMTRQQQKVYNWKAEQYDTDPAKRVHCHMCGWWLNPYFYDDISSVGKTDTTGQTSATGTTTTIGTCPSCTSITCIECKSAWRPGHTCAAAANKIRPPWLPAYSDEARVKLCPAGCRTWIELIEGDCNHVRCRTCNLEFCFVCLTPWEEWHSGCPCYGEPKCGYDADGYEVDRGIHRDTGLDRLGRGRVELERLGPGVAAMVHIVRR
ncbi:hypothetical protein P171DRAFT_495490 [Karstenula rhodostoma CBS 690.94]|uniref:RBR-type E3 ubiquitin transferase n=1 Tax=Karstenula rhodostoma CBS 690.94 TaxID=1392251 RepID=A0A9P4PGL9_9PLEO|nr:hypothetical protein P171DRAFT_495490 [Karstenula rhodostoma CBS 690.94]